MPNTDAHIERAEAMSDRELLAELMGLLSQGTIEQRGVILVLADRYIDCREKVKRGQHG